ncbi:MAG: hypothetical protein AB7O88_27895 [Reyranellaceae bacterium]
MKTQPTIHHLVSKWPTWFPDCPPFGPFMRSLFTERWLRIYSLPEGKRYATSDQEVATILRRHNDVAEAVLGDGMACAVIIAGDGDDPPSLHALGARPVKGWAQRWMDDEEFAEELEGMEFAAALCTWQRDKFNELIHDIAEDRTDLLLFASLGTGRIYGPYDGGADLFFESEESRDRFADRFSEWRSPRHDGL